MKHYLIHETLPYPRNITLFMKHYLFRTVPRYPRRLRLIRESFFTRSSSRDTPTPLGPQKTNKQKFSAPSLPVSFSLRERCPHPPHACRTLPRPPSWRARLRPLSVMLLETSEDTLIRHLTLFDLVIIGVAGTIGTGVFAIVGLIGSSCELVGVWGGGRGLRS